MSHRAHLPRLHAIHPSERLRGLGDSLRAWRRTRRGRALADEWLLWGAVPRESAELLSRRAEELTSARTRAALAKLCREFLHELDNPRCRAYAINRPAMRAHRARLTALAERLGDLRRPVTPRGVILAQRLLRDGAGPLFDPARADELGPAAAEALRALDGI